MDNDHGNGALTQEGPQSPTRQKSRWRFIPKTKHVQQSWRARPEAGPRRSAEY